MPDVELRQLRNRRDRGDIVERQPVPGVGLDAVLGGERGGVRDALIFGHRFVARHMGIAPGVDSTTGAPSRKAASTCRSLGSMNRLTRIPAAVSRSTNGRNT